MQRGTASEVAAAFFKLGMTSFGGPVAHLGYFRDEFVRRRAWLDEEAYAGVVALAQFLPGPASSQTAMLVGYMRAGATGAAAAWIGFTVPSALLMMCFALALLSRAEALNGPMAVAAVHGLKLVAVPIVAQAVCQMARTLCPDPRRAAMAVLAGAAMLVLPGAMSQIATLAASGIAGVLFLRRTPGTAAFAPRMVSPKTGVICLAGFAGLLLLLPAARDASPLVGLADAMYRAGALVFGGGHVVLPLLREAIVGQGWLSDETFLAGYGAAQAVPGPLFSVAAFIGMLAQQPALGWAGSITALAAIFVPGALILFGVLPFWARICGDTRAWGLLKGVNAAVVGILAAALYDPVATTAVTRWPDAAIAIAGFAALMVWRAPPWSIVLGTVAGSCAVALI